MGVTDLPRHGAFFMNNCGYYRDVGTSFSVLRPSGRWDIHILFCVRGSITAEKTHLSAGDMYVYPPYVPQKYTYEAAPDSLYYWVHFAGDEMTRALADLKIEEGVYRTGARAHDAERLFRLLTSSVGEWQEGMEQFSRGILYSLLALLTLPSAPSNPYYQAIKLLDDVKSEVSVGELAAQYSQSREHFIRSFRGFMGVSPHRYRQKRRMDHARILLADTDLPISRVAEEVGFADAQYFSRIFKKEVGVSPLTFRKREK